MNTRGFLNYGGCAKRQCHADGVGYPFSSGHINVKTLVAVPCAFPREVCMSGALERLDLPHEGMHHRAGEDAWNVAAILAKVLCAARRSGPFGD